MALQRTDQKYILSFHNTDSPQCIARTRFYHLYKRGRVMIFQAKVKGRVRKFHSHCRDGSPHFRTQIYNSHPPSPLLISDKSLKCNHLSMLPYHNIHLIKNKLLTLPMLETLLFCDLLFCFLLSLPPLVWVSIYRSALPDPYQNQDCYV